MGPNSCGAERGGADNLGGYGLDPGLLKLDPGLTNLDAAHPLYHWGQLEDRRRQAPLQSSLYKRFAERKFRLEKK